MAILRTVTTAGEALLAQGGAHVVSRVEIGTGNVTTLALAMAVTGVQTPFSPIKQTAGPPTHTAGNTFQVTYVDQEDTAAYVIYEFAVFVGNTCIAYICDDAGAALDAKAAGIDKISSLLFTYSGGVVNITNYQYVITPLGTENGVGLVQLATDAEVLAAFTVAPVAPADANVVTLGSLYANRDTIITNAVALASSAELQAALAGADPASAIENKVVTLQAIYDRRGDFGPRHTRVTAAPTAQQIAASNPGDIWMQV